MELVPLVQLAHLVSPVPPDLLVPLDRLVLQDSLVSQDQPVPLATLALLV